MWRDSDRARNFTIRSVEPHSGQPGADAQVQKDRHMAYELDSDVRDLLQTHLDELRALTAAQEKTLETHRHRMSLDVLEAHERARDLQREAIGERECCFKGCHAVAVDFGDALQVAFCADHAPGDYREQVA